MHMFTLGRAVGWVGWGLSGLRSLWRGRGRAGLRDKVCPEGVCPPTTDPSERLSPWLQDALMTGWMSLAHLAQREGGRGGACCRRNGRDSGGKASSQRPQSRLAFNDFHPSQINRK